MVIATAYSARWRAQDALMVAVAPGIILTGYLNWDLWAVALLAWGMWTRSRGRPALATGHTPALFLNARGGRLSRQSAWEVITTAAGRADLAGHVRADVCVLCLVGERGREADDFWRHCLDEPARQRSVMVVATSDRPAMERVRAAIVAAAVTVVVHLLAGRRTLVSIAAGTLAYVLLVNLA